MKALCTESGEKKEIMISGTKDEWEVLADQLLMDKGEVNCTVVDPSPYAIASPKILVQYDSLNKVIVDIDPKGIVTVAGSPQVCQELSELIQFFAGDCLPGEHFHLDYLDSLFVDEQSAFITFHME